eukprot:jgi/Hompol1/908/HPOL_001601-RA
MATIRDLFRRDSDSSELSFSESDNDDNDTSEQLIPEQEPFRIGTQVTHPVNHAQGRVIEVHESTAGGCGGKAWEAATVLSHYISFRRSTNNFPYRSIIELGSGTGMVGLVAAIDPLPGQHVVLTDMEQYIDLMTMNANLNLTPAERPGVSVDVCFWGTPLTETLKAKMPFDLILASDCVYLEAAFDPLIQTLEDLSSETTETWIASKKRRKADKRFWTKVLKRFDAVELVDDPMRHVYRLDSITLFKLTRKLKT